MRLSQWHAIRPVHFELKSLLLGQKISLRNLTVWHMYLLPHDYLPCGNTLQCTDILPLSMSFIAI